jgi:hypothetical protein
VPAKQDVDGSASMSKQWPDWSKEENDLKKSARVKLQATDEELFGHLVRTEEQIKKAETEYENKLNKWYAEANKNIDNQEIEWGEGKSFNSTLTEQERLKRNMHLGEDTDI